METKLGNSKDVFLIGVHVHKVSRTRQGRCLDQRSDCRWIVAFNVAFEFRPKTLELRIMAGEFSTATAEIHRITADKFFFARIFEVLPAWHPANRGIGNIVWNGRLTHEPRWITVTWTAVKMIAQVPTQLAAGIGNARGPVPGLRVQHDVRRLNARRG